MNKCTWKACAKEGKIPQLDKNGGQWAILCEEHDKELTDGIIGETFNPKTALRNWVLASGGADKMMERMG